MMLMVGILMMTAGYTQAERYVFIDTAVLPYTEDDVTRDVEDIIIKLDDENAPQTVYNFMNYVSGGYYNDTFIHRSVDNFVIQGCGYAWDYDIQGYYDIDTLKTDGTPYTETELVPLRILDGNNEVQTYSNVLLPGEVVCPNEPGISNTRGTIAMAKRSDDLVDETGNVIVPAADSATNEWFVNLADNTHLDTQNDGFTVFGEVISSDMDVVDAIAQIQQYNAGGAFTDLPLLNYSGGYVSEDHLVIFYDVRETLKGDINCDGIVNAPDLTALLSNYGDPDATSWELGNFDQNGVTNAPDLVALLANYGTSVVESRPMNPTPEPASALTFLFLFALAVSRDSTRKPPKSHCNLLT